MIETNKRQPFIKNRRLATVTLFLFIGFLLLLSFSIYRATPGPEGQAIWGVGIGDWESEDGIAFLSGRRLRCESLAEDAAYQTYCTVPVKGKMLEVWSAPSANEMMQFSGSCTAVYQGETLNCEYGSRHIHVHSFTFIEQPAQLSSRDMAMLRLSNFFENRSETFFIILIFATGALFAVLGLWNSAVWLESYWQNQAGVALTSFVSAGTLFFVGLWFTILLTNPFWD